MEFIAIDNVPTRIVKGRTYFGGFAWKTGDIKGIRIVVFDERKEWMTFNPKIFRPAQRERQ